MNVEYTISYYTAILSQAEQDIDTRLIRGEIVWNPGDRAHTSVEHEVSKLWVIAAALAGLDLLVGTKSEFEEFKAKAVSILQKYGLQDDQGQQRNLSLIFSKGIYTDTRTPRSA